MRIRVLYGIDYLKPELWEEYPNMTDCIIEWDYSVLPREQETVDNFECFITSEIKKDLSQRTVGEFFTEEYLTSIQYSKEDQKKVSVFDFLSEITCKIKEISWTIGKDNKPLPCIYISPKNG
jgi:hypothetical protein